jgi:hypothetical protein
MKAALGRGWMAGVRRKFRLLYRIHRLLEIAPRHAKDNSSFARRVKSKKVNIIALFHSCKNRV